MLNTSLLTIFVLLIPVIIPLIIIGIVKLCDKSSKPVQNNTFNMYPQQPCVPYAPQQFPAQPPMPAPSAPEKEKKHDMTVSNVLFLIGTAFVVLSGLAFGVAKWVHTSHEGRVAIIGAAALVTFLLSAVVGKFLKLSGTSTSFFVLGTGFTATAFLTAGYYELMGQWLSFSGGGTFALLAISTAMTTALLFAGCKLFSKLPLIYTALSTTALTALFAVLQISTDLMVNSPIFLAFEAAITAALFAAKSVKDSKYALPFNVVGSCSAFVYSIFPAAYILKSASAPTAVTYIIFAAIIAQLIFYGKKTKESVLISIASMVEVFLAYSAAKDIAAATSNRYGMLAFSGFAFLLFAAHRFVPLFKNPFTEAMTLAVSVIGTFICFGSTTSTAFVPEFITGVIASLIIASYILHSNEIIQSVAGFASPVIPFLLTCKAASMLAPLLGLKDTAPLATVCWSIFALILILSTVLLMALPKIAFNFHANHPRKTDIVLYVNMTVSGLILLILSFNNALIFIPAAICFIHFAVSNKLRANFTAIISALAFIFSVFTLIIEVPATNLVIDIAMLAVFCIYMAISRYFYPEGVAVKNNDRITADPMLLSGWLAAALMYQSPSRTCIFFLCITTAIYIACFIKKHTTEGTASILLTITASLTSLALIFRPFFVPSSAAISCKITLAIIALTGIACRYIWRKYPEASRYSSQGIFLTTFTALLIDALYFDTAVNTIFVMSVMLTVLFISIVSHSKTWFTASAIALFTITIYATREYLMALNWWIYLFIAGITLIVLAAVNEYCKKNNETLKTSVAKKFSGWNW